MLNELIVCIHASSVHIIRQLDHFCCLVCIPAHCNLNETMDQMSTLISGLLTLYEITCMTVTALFIQIPIFGPQIIGQMTIQLFFLAGCVSFHCL